MSKTYRARYGGFVGADFSSAPGDVARNRMPYCVNLWRDYHSGQGGAVETVPGFRRLFRIADDEGTRINGLYSFEGFRGQTFIIAHVGHYLYRINGDFTGVPERIRKYPYLSAIDAYMEDADSDAVVFGNAIYIVDGSHYYRVMIKDGHMVAYNGQYDGYVPTTYVNGTEYEQRNLLRDELNEVYTQNATGDTYASVTGGVSTVTGFDGEYSAEVLYINADQPGVISGDAFTGNTDLRVVYINRSDISVAEGAFIGCEHLRDVYFKGGASGFVMPGDQMGLCFPSGTTIHYSAESSIPADACFAYYLHDRCDDVYSVYVEGSGSVSFRQIFKKMDIGGAERKVVERILLEENPAGKKVTINAHVIPSCYTENARFGHAGDGSGLASGYAAVSGCRKCAVYDGRVFLTGNPDLPNTVFYSQRDNTGANNPLYFGVYNYFNDGDGSAVNTGMLGTPSGLMVFKGNTEQDGTVYIHTATYNTDEASADLMPRLYPALEGVTGVGCVGGTVNFRDDPVFLSANGLEAVGKRAVNLERSVIHRSECVDRRLNREALQDADMTVWDGYLVVCCQGHIYLADSRVMSKHEDGSAQYEWFYLEGVGTYEGYATRYRNLDNDAIYAYPYENAHGLLSEQRNLYKIRGDTSYVAADTEVIASSDANGNTIYTYQDGSIYLCEPAWGGEKRGTGTFFPARKVCRVGERLLFGTDGGDICCVNTDKRGLAVDGESIEPERIDRSFYSFAGIAYPTVMATCLDDADNPVVAKATVSGTVAFRMKTMAGASFRITVSTDGKVWKDICKQDAGRAHFGEVDFSGYSFAGFEETTVMPDEIERGWARKQYCIRSDGYCNPFGVEEIAYCWYASGRVRYI